METDTPRALLGGGERVALRGTIDGAVEALPDGRARARLREAVLEGPAEVVRGERVALEATLPGARGGG
jgi:hypothetical protein